MDAAIQSRSLSVGDLFRTGWSLYRDHFKNILLVILCVYIPVNLIIALIPENLIYQMFDERAYQFYLRILQLLEFLIGSIATMGVSILIEKSLRGTVIGWGPALQHGLSRWGAMIGTGLLFGIIVGALSFLLIIPGIIWGVYYTFWIYVVSLRNLGGKQALDYSKSLVVGQWWRVFGISLFIGILNFIAAFVIAFLFIFISENPFFEILPNTLSDIVSGFFTVLMVVFFLNVDYLKNPVTAPAEAPSMLVPAG